MSEQAEPEPKGEQNGEQPRPDPDALKAARERDEAAAEAPAGEQPEAPAEPAAESDPTSQAIANAHLTYMERVFEALGPGAEIRPCSACGGMGFGALELPHAGDKERCSECQGYGTVETGSLVESQRVLPCSTCRGNGWTAKVSQIQAPPPPTFLQPVPQPEAAQYTQQLPPAPAIQPLLPSAP